MAIQLRRGLNADRITITPESGEPLWTTDTKLLYIGDGSTVGGNLVGGGGTGDVVGPSSSVNNRVVFFNGTTGKLIKDSGLTLSPAALTRVNDTNVTLTLGGTPATSLLAATSLTLGWTGQLSTTRGGTGLSALGTSNQLIRVNSGATALEYFTPPYITTAVTSVGMTVPSAFSVTPSTITTSGTFAVTGAGSVSQYVRGDGTLATYNPGTGGGGASVSYYLNGSVTQGTFGGVSMREINKTPIIGTGTDFTISANGYIQSFITDIGDPNQLSIPSGNWNFEMWFSASSGGGSPSFYVELYKWDGTALTSIASSSATPENITGGTSTDLYTTALSVPPTTLALTDRLAIRVYVTHSGRTITLHTENSHLCQVITTFTTGLTALNGLTEQVQYFSTGTSGTDFAISSTGTTHTFNLPTASASNRGLLNTADWTIFNSKEPAITAGTTLQYYRGDKTFQTLNTTVVPEGTNLYYLDSRARTAISLTTTGSSGAATYSNTTGVFNIPDYGSALSGYVPTSRQLTINGTAFDLSADRSWSVGTVTSVTGTTPIVSSGGTAPAISILAATTSVDGYLKSTDWTIFNGKQNALTLTTTGTSGAATLVGSTLNIPQYSGGGGGGQNLETIIAWDGNGSFITGNNTRYAVLSNGGTISGWSIVAIGTSPTCTIDVLYVASGTALPSLSITGGGSPALATGNSIYSTTLTSWTTTTIAAGGTLGFRITAISNVLQLKITLIYS